MRLSAVPELVFVPSAAETLLIGFLDETFIAFRSGTDYLCAYFGFPVELVVAFIVRHALFSFCNEILVRAIWLIVVNLAEVSGLAIFGSCVVHIRLPNLMMSCSHFDVVLLV
jgi:hypothetical protein